MAGDTLDKLIDKLPYIDGSGRRRFVAGGIILIGIAAFNWATMQSALGKIGIKDILSSPVLAGGALLLIYAIGSIVDMVGELFLVRAASGLFWAIAEYVALVKQGATRTRRIVRLVLGGFRWPLQAVFGVILGFFGRTHYTLPIEAVLSDQAKTHWQATPSKVMAGIYQPVGNESELAIKHIIDQLATEEDRKWARRMIIRVREVSATTTALLVVVLYGLLVGRISLWREPLVEGGAGTESVNETAITKTKRQNVVSETGIWLAIEDNDNKAGAESHKHARQTPPGERAKEAVKRWAAGQRITEVITSTQLQAVCTLYSEVLARTGHERLREYAEEAAAGELEIGCTVEAGQAPPKVLLLSIFIKSPPMGTLWKRDEALGRMFAPLERLWRAWWIDARSYKRRRLVLILLTPIPLLLLYGGVFISYRTAITAILEAGMMQAAATMNMQAPQAEPPPQARDTEEH